MSLQTFIQAMPKADIGLQFEGALPRDLLALFSEQNDIPASMKPSQYRDLMSQLDKTDPKRIYEVVGRFARWISYPDDLTRSIYEIGLNLRKQNVRYAEIHISPSIYTQNMPFETFLNAINDGRDRLWRAWQVRVNWVLCIPRDDPRSGDDVARYAISPLARRGNVLGLGLTSIRINREVAKRPTTSSGTRRSGASTVSSTAEADDIQPVGQFVRPFTSAQKRELPTVTMAHNHPKMEVLSEIVSTLSPTRLLEAGEGLREEGVLQTLADRNLACVITPSRELRLNKVSSLADYPYQAYANQLNLSFSASMPTFLRTTLSDELILAAEHGQLSVEQIEAVCLNAVLASFLPSEEKMQMVEEFRSSYAALRAEHLS